MILILCVLQLADNQIIESKLIQVNKKKIVYIFVVTIKVVYLQCVKAITHADMMDLYSVSVG